LKAYGLAEVPSSARRRIAILSVNGTPWGGSEELWFQAALALAAEGAQVRVLKPRLPIGCRRVARLRAAGCAVSDLTSPMRLPRQIYEQITRFSRQGSIVWLMFWAGLALIRFRPQLVVLGQGGNWDGVHFGFLLKCLKLPYVIISQKAAELYWPPDKLRRHVQKLYREARHALFVSNHNWQLTEMQIGERLTHASVARNPFLVDFDRPLAWPAEPDTVNLACVGRLYPMEKGQDVLLQVMALPKWRSRRIRLTFYGEGVNEEGLRGIAQMLGLENVHFAGQVTDVAQIWRDNQALVLPSRAEGLPLVIVEAMLAGRVVVTTSAGGSAEVIDDNACGFVSESCSVSGIDGALERAWARLDDWPQIGSAAAKHIRGLVPADPGAELARELMRVSKESGLAWTEPKLSNQSVASTALID